MAHHADATSSRPPFPLAAIINLVSYNYMTYYNMYEEMEWGVRPHQADLMDELWQRSSLQATWPR